MERLPFALRPAVPDDAPAIAEVHVLSWKSAYRGLLPQSLLDEQSVHRRARQWRSMLTRPATATVLAEDASGLLGFIGVGPSRDEREEQAPTGEVYVIYLRPDVWRRGVGRQLWRDGVARLRELEFEEVTVWVLASNERARGFYRAMGLSPDGWQRSERRGDALLDEVRYRGPLGADDEGQRDRRRGMDDEG